MIDNRIFISYDKPVYSDIQLTVEKTGLHVIKSSTQLPTNVFFSNVEYKGQATSTVGEILFNVRFTYPDHISNNGLSVDTGAIYDEE